MLLSHGPAGLRAWRRWLMSLLVAVPLAACGSAEQANGPPGGGQPAEVGFVVAKATDVAIPTELSGRASASAVAEVRPQVSGLVQQRAFTEGGYVRAGQTLYRIDPSIYSAQANEAQAQLTSARASEQAARVKAQRYRPLAEMEAISKQDYTDAQAAQRQAAAQAQVASAQLASANVGLRNTRVPAPISGRIGRSLVTKGALVTMNQADPLAVIQQLDPIYVDLQQSSDDLLALRRSLARDGTVPDRANVKLILGDGSEYGPPGQIRFTETLVDESTGAVTLRASFPNPEGLLLPGMFVRARLIQEVDSRSFLIPQAAVTRDATGEASVLIVGEGNKVEVRKVTADRALGANWVVTAGLRGGERIITQGTAKAQPGTVVKPVPANTPQQVGAAPASKNKPAN